MLQLTRIILYVKTSCPYCAKVRIVAEELGVVFEERNIANTGVADELRLRGGKCQVPYLLDEKNGVGMYESSAIVDYLQKTYGT